MQQCFTLLKPCTMQKIENQRVIVSPRDGVEYAVKVNRSSDLSNVKRDFTFHIGELDPRHVCTVVLSESLQLFKDACRLLQTPFFVRFEQRANNVQDLAPYARMLPSIHRALNQSRRMRRLGVTGARLCNVFRRGESFWYVADTVLDSAYSCVVVAYSILQEYGASSWKTSRVIVKLRRHGYGKRSEADTVGAFIRAFREHARYYRGKFEIDPLGCYEVRISPTVGSVSFGLLQLLLEELRTNIDQIYIGSFMRVSTTCTSFDDDFEDTVDVRYRHFRMRYFSPFGDLYKRNFKS